MFKLKLPWCKKETEEPNIKPTESDDTECIDDYTDEEYCDEVTKDTQLLEYINSLKADGLIKNALISMKSSQDINMIVVVDDTRITEAIMKLEVSMYTIPALNVKNANRVRNKIMVLTKSDATFNIKVIGKSDFEEHYYKKE